MGDILWLFVTSFAVYVGLSAIGGAMVAVWLMGEVDKTESGE